MVEPIESGKAYSVRMSHLPKGEMDAIIVAKEGVVIIPLRDGRYKIIAKNFAGLHALENLRTGFVAKRTYSRETTGTRKRNRTDR